jgi:PKD repeat protein
MRKMLFGIMLLISSITVSWQNPNSLEDAIDYEELNDDRTKQVLATPMVYVENFYIPINNAASGSIIAQNVVNLGSCEVRLEWDPLVLEVVDLNEEKSDFDSCFSYFNNEKGMLNITAFDIEGLSGNILIAEVTFKSSPRASVGDTCTIGIKKSELYDATQQGKPIPHYYENGTATIIEIDGEEKGKYDQNDTNSNPIAIIITSQTTAFVGTLINFDASKSWDPDGDILSFYWDFGDGNSSTEEVTTHIYTHPREYIVTLTVEDGKGGSDVASQTIVIMQANKPPTEPVINGTSQGHKNENYTYSIFSTDADNDPIKYFIEWGDGSKEETGFSQSGEIVYLNHSWERAGKYIIKIFASDNKTVSAVNEYMVLIDAKIVGSIGYIMDKDGDEIYDTFYNEFLGEEIPIKQTEEDYLIDADKDGEWDFIYNLSTGTLSNYGKTKEESKENLLVLLGVAIIVIIILIAVARKGSR